MNTTGILSLVIIAINLIISYLTFNNKKRFDQFSFQVGKVLYAGEYYRIFTSGFLHVNWLHLLFNMVTLYSFSFDVIRPFEPLPFLVIYFTSLVGGNLFSLWVNKANPSYTAVGASGAVCGIVFACIAIIPDMSIGLFGLPQTIPGWIYALAFMLISAFGVKSKFGNIGHDAHLMGALTGMWAAIAIYPASLDYNLTPIVLIFLPSIIILFVLFLKPTTVLSTYSGKPERYQTIDDRYNDQKVEKEKEIDRILEKIHQKGIQSLSKYERDVLDEYSKR